MSSKIKPRVLVVDDEEDIRISLKRILDHEGLECHEAASGPEALSRVDEVDPHAVLLDIKMPRMDGIEVLAELRKQRPELPVIMISGHGTIANAVEAIHLGAFHYIEKPFSSDRVLLELRNALKLRRLEQEVRGYRLSFEERYRMVGESAALREVQQAVARIAPTKTSVLITGESGTGKELVARAIHRNSPRAQLAFVQVNCAAIPEELIESELFGHVKGSFTGAIKDQLGKFVSADGGTILLDEIGDMSLKTQAKVLRVLQEGEVEPVGAAKTLTVDVRVVAATNKNLPDELAAGRFREDLYFRLNVLPLHLPPLRERREDIEPLVQHLIGTFCTENNYRPKKITPAAMEQLRQLPWRGNVRELRNAVERLIIMTPGDSIDVGDLPAELGLALDRDEPRSAPGALVVAYEDATLQQFKERAEREFLVAKLRANSWNRAATAKAIDTPRSNLYKKLVAHDISQEKDDPRDQGKENP
jgi:two-component system nitrogen regulation response regulator NtrX